MTGSARVVEYLGLKLAKFDCQKKSVQAEGGTKSGEGCLLHSFGQLVFNQTY